MKKNVLTLILVFIASFIFAKQVEVKHAATIAKNAFFERVNLHYDVDYNEINLKYVKTIKQSGYNIYHIFDAQAKNIKGFVVISGDDVVKPLLAYSFEGNYTLDNPSPEQSFYMSKYQEQILHAIKTDIKANEKVQAEWQKYEFAQKSTEDIQTVEPLVKTKFGQSFPYNEMCPSNSQGQAVTGCVATTYAQILKYWGYPAQGTGDHSYYASGFGTQYANFGATQYHFENIPLQGSGSNEYLARLMYHCGVAVEMHYGIDGSGSYSWNIASTIDDYFGYSSDADYIQKNNYSDASWLNIIKNQIDNGWPTEYDGSNDEGGHSWVCDGYDGDMLHMNWGWEGSGNGYYEITDLTPPYNSTFDTDGAVINLYPDNVNTSCNSMVITGFEGNFNDGSVPGNYQANLNCEYLVQPECASFVTLNFNSCELASGDHIYIYDGDNTNAPLLHDIDASTNVSVIGDINGSSDDGILVKFVTNTGGAEGWDISYTSRKCKFITYLNDLEDTFNDGSKSCDYSNSTSCKWYIEPNGTFDKIIINFNSFNLGDVSDYVRIYSGHSTSSSDLVAELNAGDTPSTYTINDTNATVRFITSSDGAVSDGWEIHYVTGTTGIDNLSSSNKIKVYPNPFDNDASIYFNSTSNENVNISIVNLVGEKIAELKTQVVTGENIFKISEITPNLNKGVYFVKIKYNGKQSVKKIIVK